MENVISEYLAEKFCADIRAGAPASSELCSALTSFPVIDYLRSRIQIEDFERLQVFCDSDDPAKQNLGLALLRNIESIGNVRTYLENLWHRASLSFRSRIGLQFQLSNYADLDPAMRQRFLTFILNHWQEFLDNQIEWCNTGEGVLDFCRQRLADTRFPASKNWLYLCVAAASSDRDAARALVQSYANDLDPFKRKVASEVLERLALPA